MFTPKSMGEEIILLVYKIARMVREHTDADPDMHEPSMLQLQALIVISSDGRTMGQVADELHMKLPTATLLVNRLVESGCVERVSGNQDRRVIKIRLTKLGTKTLSDQMKKRMKRMKFVMDQISEKDHAVVYRILQNLYTKLFQSWE